MARKRFISRVVALLVSLLSGHLSAQETPWQEFESINSDYPLVNVKQQGGEQVGAAGKIRRPAAVGPCFFTIEVAVGFMSVFDPGIQYVIPLEVGA